jgi:16S rRNA (cytosine967-C5)-methyltransferase
VSADPVRRRALDLLIRTDDGRPLDRALDRARAELRSGGGDARDAAFLGELVRGTLQWRDRYDHLIGVYAARRPPRDPRLRWLLRLSLHQLLALDGVPARAVLHQAGELCRSRLSTRLVGFVNGLLQTARRELRPRDDLAPAERRRRLRAAFRPLEADGAAWLAAWHSLPLWLVAGWLRRWEPATVAGICEATNSAPPVFLRVLEGADPEEVAALLAAEDVAASRTDDPRCLELGGRPRRETIAALLARHRRLIVQDATVQAATSWLLDGVDESAVPVVDLCAAPGGKTARLAAALPGAGLLVAADRSAARAGRLIEAAKRLEKRPVSVVIADGLTPAFRRGSCGTVLVDGPCSGTGVLRHHPEGRWLLEPETARRHGFVLLELARRATELLRPGGVLLYATCSLETQENERVLGALLHAAPELAPAPDAEGRWQRRWLPGQAPGDGFFAARLRRRTAP